MAACSRLTVRWSVVSPAVGAVLDRRGQHCPLAFVAQVDQYGVGLVGPLGQQRRAPA
jgi:hypothetical protein